MKREIQQFGAAVRQRLPEDLDDLTTAVAQTGADYASLDRTQLRQDVEQIILTLIESMEREDPALIVTFARRISQSRSQHDFSISEVLNATEVVRSYIWEQLLPFMRTHTTWSPEMLRQMEDMLHQLSNNIVSGFEDALQQVRTELSEQNQQLEVQSQMIRELSTPILPVHEGIIVVPLVGALDSFRATQVMESLLQAISFYQSDIVIIDITGVPMVDTNVANYLLQAARAANLVGASIVLVGIGAEIAQTMVQLGVDLSRITTLANLQEGLEYAFRTMGYTITLMDRVSGVSAR
jgi:rsbT co-antagonist protein RsbR